MSLEQSINKTQVMGRVGKDPEVRTVGTGTKVATISIATNEGYFNKATPPACVEATEWHRVTLWGRQAEKAEKKCRKGDVVYVEGKLKTDSWDDADGKKRYSTSIQAQVFKVVYDNGRAADMRANGGQAPQSQHMPTPGGPAPEGDLPF